MQTLEKKNRQQLSKNFISTEFNCKGNGCCSQTMIDEKLVDYLQKIRDHFKRPITITSAYRCAIHNRNVGGATGSYHSQGKAADIVVDGATPLEVAQYAESIGIKGIGLYETDSDGHFVHIDTRTYKSFWYGQKQQARSTFGGADSEEKSGAYHKAKTKYSVKLHYLQLGDQGEDVRILQELLKIHGYSLQASGVFDSITLQMVKDFQKKNKLVVDGIVGSATMQKLLGSEGGHKMSNSPLVDFTLITSNSSPRAAKISAITIHHMATDGSVESCGRSFTPARRASSNYGVDSKGRVGLYVDESRRSWCSSNLQNDNRAITIEVANCSREPEWRVNDIAFEKTIELCVDICKRNDIPYLNYTGDESGNFTMHCWFQNTGCPGPYMISRYHEIANEVNRRLGRADKTNYKLIEPFELGEKVQLLPGAKYNEGNSCPSFFINQTFYVREVMGNYVKISTLQTGPISGVVHKKYLKSLDKQNNSSNQSAENKKPIKEPESKNEKVSFSIGEKVRLEKGAKYYNGKSIPTWLFNKDLYVRKVSEDRITFSIYSTGAITGDTHSSNLTKI